MDTLEDIERAVERLPPEELSKFRDWFEELQARLWDAEIERDVAAGNLDWLIEETKAAEKLPLPTKKTIS